MQYTAAILALVGFASAATQIADGQIQAPATESVAPVSQISDGQVQAPTSTPAATVAPVSQIADGQVQAPSTTPEATVAPISQISDGQIQAPTAVSSVIVPSTNGTLVTPTAPAATFTGAANILAWSQEMAMVAVGAAAGAALL